MFSLKTIAGIATVLTSFAPTFALPLNELSHTLSKRDSCSGGEWVAPLTIGGSGGAAWCETHWTGGHQIITGVTSWTDGVRIRGIQFTYDDGTVSVMHGSTDNTKSSLKLAAGEHITSCTLWGDGNGSRLGHINMQTDKGQTLDLGRDIRGEKAYDINVGGGVLLGAYGLQGDDIDSMGLLFLSAKVDSITIGNIVYDSDPTGTSTNMESTGLATSHYSAEAGSQNGTTWSFTGSQLETITNTYTQSTTGTFGESASVEFSAEPLGVGSKITGGYEWSVSHETTSSQTTTEAKTLTWNQAGTLKPGTGVTVTASAEKGTGNFPYTSTVTMKLVGGQTIVYTEKGVLTNVAFSDATISMKEDDALTSTS